MSTLACSPPPAPTPVEVRTPEHLAGVDCLVIPGGESTTMGKLARAVGLVEPVRARVAGGMPVFGTCAGMIVLARACRWRRAAVRRPRRDRAAQRVRPSGGLVRGRRRRRGHRPSGAGRVHPRAARGGLGPEVRVSPSTRATPSSWSRGTLARGILPSRAGRRDRAPRVLPEEGVAMSGHSKWATIKRKKGATDAKRSNMYAKLLRAVEVAAREGGGNVDGNMTLASAVEKAKSFCVPNDNIERAIKRGTGETTAARATRSSSTRDTRPAASPCWSRPSPTTATARARRSATPSRATTATWAIRAARPGCSRARA